MNAEILTVLQALFFHVNKNELIYIKVK